MGSNAGTSSRLTIPNALCTLRLLGCPVLLYLAAQGLAMPFLYVFVFLVFTDWIDGKIARWLNQRSTFGARLDSLADAATYGCLVLAACWLKPDVARAEWPWVAVALLTYAAAGVAGLVKFRRWPAYHTRSAKICWFMNAAAVVCLFADISIWPLRVAMVCVALANLESLAITMVLANWRADVPSIIHAARLKAASMGH